MSCTRFEKYKKTCWEQTFSKVCVNKTLECSVCNQYSIFDNFIWIANIGQRTSFPTSFIVNIWIPLINKLVVSFQCLLVGILQYVEHRVIFIHRVPTLMGYYYFIFVYYYLKWILVNVFRWPLWWKRCQLWPLVGQIWAGLVLPIVKWPKNVLLITNRIV
jgi:hypothetical protein